MKIRLFCIYLILLHYTLIASSQSDARLIDNWKSHNVPANKDTLSSYNWSDTNWIVYAKDSKVMVREMMDSTDRPRLPFKTPDPKSYSKMEEFSGKRSFVQVDNGYLVAFWRGEFGAGLFWFSSDGTEYYRIKGGGVIQFIKKGNEIFGLSGLAHLNFSYGSMLKFTLENNKWVAKEYLKLPFAPYAASLDAKNNFIIVTSDNLLKVGSGKKIKVLLKTDFWQGLYPTSSVIQGEAIYIGMRKGVYKFNLRTKESWWLLPQ